MGIFSFLKPTKSTNKQEELLQLQQRYASGPKSEDANFDKLPELISNAKTEAEAEESSYAKNLAEFYENLEKEEITYSQYLVESISAKIPPNLNSEWDARIAEQYSMSLFRNAGWWSKHGLDGLVAKRKAQMPIIETKLREFANGGKEPGKLEVADTGKYKGNLDGTSGFSLNS